MAPLTRSAYATWWEAYELSGAQATEAAIGDRRNTQRDPDELVRDEGVRDMTGMDPDEALAVLRHLPAESLEVEAFGALEGELATLRVQRQGVLDLADGWERYAWSNGGDRRISTAVRALREALGAA